MKKQNAVKRWQQLPAKTRRMALRLFLSERYMWRYGKGTNWHPDSLEIVKENYRVCGIAVDVLRETAKKRKR